jgi:hypothetical protein
MVPTAIQEGSPTITNACGDVEERRFQRRASSQNSSGLQPLRYVSAAAFDLDVARVGRTLLSDAFDFVFAFDSDSALAFDFAREGHGFSRAAKDPPKSTRLQPREP